MLAGVHIERAAMTDAAEILTLQKLAYQSEAVLYDDFMIPPLRQTQKELEEELSTHIVLKACVEGQITGSVRAFAQDGTCFIGKLIVHPDHRRQGLGTHLMKCLEEHFPDIHRFELFTGHQSKGNLQLYTNLGYRVFHEKTVSDKLTLLFLEK